MCEFLVGSVSVEQGDTATLGQDVDRLVGLLGGLSSGSTQIVLRVPTIVDPVFEDDETFTVTISNPTNATILDGVAKGTILNDELVPTASMLASGRICERGCGDAVLMWWRSS